MSASKLSDVVAKSQEISSIREKLVDVSEFAKLLILDGGRVFESLLENSGPGSRLRLWESLYFQDLITLAHCLLDISAPALSQAIADIDETPIDEFYYCPDGGVTGGSTERSERIMDIFHTTCLLPQKEDLRPISSVGTGNPWRFKSIDTVIGQSVPASALTPGVYFLLLGEEVVYVGQSEDTGSRLFTHHKSSKRFDRYSVLPVAPEFLDEVEAEYILHYLPKLNKSVPVNDWHKPSDQARRDFGLSSKRDLYSLSQRLELWPVTFLGELFYPVAQMKAALEKGVQP